MLTVNIKAYRSTLVIDSVIILESLYTGFAKMSDKNN